jgi:hypothetical protein
VTVSWLRHAWVWVALAVLVLVGVTAAAGGLEPVTEDPVIEVEPGDRVDVGPFRMSLVKAVTAKDREALVEKDERRPRHLMVAVEVSTTSDVYVDSALLGDLVRPADDDAVVRGPDGTPSDPLVFGRADGVHVDTINPGQTYELVLRWEQEPGWRGEELTFEIVRLAWVEDDPTTLDDKRWRVTGEVGHRAELPVRKKRG